MKKPALFLSFVMLATATVRAQEWAKARLEKSPRHYEWVKVKDGERNVNCFVIYPEAKDKATAIVLVHEIFGLTDWARSEADQLAAAGYVVIAPDLLSGAAPGGGGTAEMGGNDAAVKAVSALPPDQVMGDLKAAAEYISKVPACNRKVVVAGFCWGGGQAFHFATADQNLKAAFVFYGTPPAAKDMKQIVCPVYGFYAGNDARVTATVPKTIEEMKAAEKTYEPVTYDGAGHGFMRAGEAPDASAANKNARDQAWKRWMALLNKS